LVGTDLTLEADILSLTLGGSDCVISASSDTSITCTLESEPLSGDHLPVVTTVHGLLVLANGITAHAIDLTLTSVAPNSGLNQAGYEVLTLTGEGFDASTSVTVGGEDCRILSTSYDEVTCETTSFAGATPELSVSSNAKTQTQTLGAVSPVISFTQASALTITPLRSYYIAVTFSGT